MDDTEGRVNEDLGLEVSPNGKQEVDVEVLTELIAGKPRLLAWSKSRLKITQDGKVKYIDVPIKSIGLAEVMEQLSRVAPVAPKIMKVIKQGTKEGRELGLSQPLVSYVEDTLDPVYQQKLREYELRSTYSLVLHGLAIDIKDENGSYIVRANDSHTATEVKAEDEDRAILVLKQSGLTGDHIQQLARDVRNLTRDEEARVDLEPGRL